jgi:hypothetical protein
VSTEIISDTTHVLGAPASNGHAIAEKQGRNWRRLEQDRDRWKAEAEKLAAEFAALKDKGQSEGDYERGWADCESWQAFQERIDESRTRHADFDQQAEKVRLLPEADVVFAEAERLIDGPEALYLLGSHDAILSEFAQLDRNAVQQRFQYFARDLALLREALG